MVTWDDSWSFTVKYSAPKNPKGRITGIQVVEYSSGNTYNVTNGGTVTVKEGRIKVKVYVKNVGDGDGTIYGQLSIDGQTFPSKSQYLQPGVATTMTWDLTISEGQHSVVVNVWHSPASPI